MDHLTLGTCYVSDYIYFFVDNALFKNTKIVLTL